VSEAKRERKKREKFNNKKKSSSVRKLKIAERALAAYGRRRSHSLFFREGARLFIMSSW
jgi:hypothetical protein